MRNTFSAGWLTELLREAGFVVERGQDPHYALLSWPGCGLDDGEVSEVIDHYLERARVAKAILAHYNLPGDFFQHLFYSSGQFL